MADTRTIIREFILSQCMRGQPPEALRDDAPLRPGILDSMAALKLVDLIEHTAKIEIEHHQLNDDNFGSVDAIVAFVEEQVAGRR